MGDTILQKIQYSTTEDTILLQVGAVAYTELVIAYDTMKLTQNDLECDIMYELLHLLHTDFICQTPSPIDYWLIMHDTTGPY